MPSQLSRRQVLAATGGSVLALSATAGAETREEACREYLTVESDLEAAESELADLETTAETKATLLDEVTTRYREIRGPPRFSNAELTEALETAREIREAVVFLDMHGETYGTGTATGWFSDDGVIVTNAHNVDNVADRDDVSRTAWTYDGEQFSFDIIDFVRGRDPDVAALDADIDPPATIPFGSSSGLSRGDLLVQIGHPGSFGNWAITVGEYLETNPRQGRDVINSTVGGLQGSSGSPIVDLDGRAVGLTYGSSEGSLDPGETPEPAGPDVRQYPLEIDMTSNHETIETVESRLEVWQ